MKKLLVLLVAVMMLGITACGGGEAETGVKEYSLEGKFNSDTVNQWKNIYLLDDKNYVITCYALDSKDNTKVTMDFVMKGEYTLADNVLTISLGHGYVCALNGDTPIKMAVTPDNGAMYYAAMGQTLSFTLNEDGSFEPIVE